MRIADSVYVLPIPRNPQESENYLNLTLIVDEENGNTLVDAGLPDQTEAIGAALGEAGIGVGDLSLPGCCRTLEREASTAEGPSRRASGVGRRSHRWPQGRSLGHPPRTPVPER